MASKPVVLLVHGMGSATPPDPKKKKLGSAGQEFVKCANKALRRYPRHKNDDIKKHVDIREFYYNDIFEKIRKEMADTAKSMSDRLGVIGGMHGQSFLPKFVGDLTGWEQRFGDDEFFYTHWLDVIFYSTFIGGAIRARFAAQLAKLIKEVGNKRIHVVAHSLGSAVVHDALAKLYPPGGIPPAGAPDFFSVEDDQLESVWMISNVCRIINTIAKLSDPLNPETTVKPGPGGCTKLLANVRHELDPFTMIRCFDPPNDGEWISTTTYKLKYLRIINDIVIEANTHSFVQYMEDPGVAFPLFRVLMGSKFKATKNQRLDAIEMHADASIQGGFSRLKQAFQNIEIADLDTVEEFLAAGEAFRDVIDNIRAQLA